MDAEARKRYILEELNTYGKVELSETASLFGVSEMTVRRDFNVLEAQGLLVRRHGGAVKTPAVDHLFSFDRRLELHGDRKKSICETAVSYIDDGEIIFIDCGTTLFRLARLVMTKRIKVITNSLPVVAELLHSPTVRLTFIGGDIDAERQASYGAITEMMIRKYTANKAFIGADGISLNHGLSSFDEKEAVVTRSMMERSDKVFLLCDSSKVEKDSFFRLAPVSAVDVLVTDSFEPIRDAGAYREQGLKLVIAP